MPDATAGLIDLLSHDVDLEVRHQAARAIAFGGITGKMVPQIFDKLKDAELRTDAALALLIGADSDTANRALAQYNDAPPEAMEELKVTYNQTFGYWSDKNYVDGDVSRWVENALGVAHVRVHESLQDWPKFILSRALQEIEFDNGPHSITRVQFRYRLMQDAKSTNDAEAPVGHRDPEVHEGEGRPHGPPERDRSDRRPREAGVLRGDEPEDRG